MKKKLLIATGVLITTSSLVDGTASGKYTIFISDSSRASAFTAVRYVSLKLPSLYKL